MFSHTRIEYQDFQVAAFYPEDYPELCQTIKMEHLVKIVIKGFILDA